MSDEVKAARDPMKMTELAERLSEPPTKSTRHMSHEERVDGVLQMLLDLERQAKGDGCIAAAWAFEKLSALTAHPSDKGEPVTGEWLESLGFGGGEGIYIRDLDADGLWTKLAFNFDKDCWHASIEQEGGDYVYLPVDHKIRTSVLSLLSALGVETPQQ